MFNKPPKCMNSTLIMTWTCKIKCAKLYFYTLFICYQRSLKWVIESSPTAITQRSGKTATLRLSGGYHLTERSWMEVGRVKRRLFIAICPFSRVYDHSLPHSRLATGDVEGE
ncbi:unnamed protein product [Spirodela intermedia]|uniref:Uncharacterized protein n=1 Tax=Spirodela intermedia TaxID=51605 RepID=A0ABN7EBR0_SPIIN|nr:unnamed protein product [Spirodela intermedia]